MEFGPKAEQIFNALWRAGQGWDDSTYVSAEQIEAVLDEARPGGDAKLQGDEQTAIKYAAISFVDLATSGRAEIAGVNRALRFCAEHAPFAGPVAAVMTRVQLDRLLQREPSLSAVAAMLGGALAAGQR